MQSSSRDRHRKNQILTSWLHCRFVSLALPACCMLTCTCICKQAGVWCCGPSTAFVSTEPTGDATTSATEIDGLLGVRVVLESSIMA